MKHEATEVTRDEMVNEAAARMKDLRILDNVIREFENGTLNCSEHIGILFWLNDGQKEIVEKFEKRTGHMVYHVIRSFTEIGEMLTLLFVSKYKEDWESERVLLNEEGYAYAYVENVDFPECSEMGEVVIKPSFGGLRRTA